jgi:hypothetical protein
LNLEGCRKLVELPDGIVKFERLQVLNLKDCEELRGMPVGIGQFSSQLQKLPLFVVVTVKSLLEYQSSQM